MTIHADWLSLIEVSGAFLAEPVLDIAFPQGLEGFPTHKRQTFRQTYEEWRDAQDNDDELKDQLHIEWINWVLRVGLEWDEDGSEEDLKGQGELPESLSLSMPEHGLVIKPDYALFGDDKSKPFVIVQSYTADTDLNKVLGSDGWTTSPAERMSHLCKATGVRLGLITNGEQWMLVDALEGSITSYATWYARLWSQEPSTLKSFYSLLNISAFFNGLGLDAKKLSELLDESLKHQDEVTETLGSQVQRAVEVLIQSLDRINKDKNGELLKGVEPSELYEAGLTYMMRLVFLLCAEERGLLLLGDETYESNYAVSTLRMKLREEAGQHGEEVLGFRNNAWSRLLAVFRAVYGGIEHEELRMPALGGSLFDPDRFPFLEGRPKGSNWRINEAHPLPIDNRTVLLFLDAIQLFQGRTLSYRALDVEQIGYVYEGLLEKTVIRADDVTLELKATQKSKTPWLKLGELASAELDGDAKVLALLQERTGSSATKVKNDYSKPLEPSQSAELLLACNNNTQLRDRLQPYFHFLREDALGKPLIYARDAFIVATGQDRRETGTHYTPKSLTEAVVKETLEPLVYEGPSIGTPREEWKLKTAKELLDLKVCDPAMGSGAFLVQVVRYLGERVCEAWEQAETEDKPVSVEGLVMEVSASEELLPPQTETEARNLIARRLVAERCIYGVDVNPLAVELAKLSIWLVTLSKGRPFGFLDHNLRSGDSLLGVHRIEQLTELAMDPTGKGQQRLFGREIEQAVKDAIELRKRIRSMPIRDIQDVNTMNSLDKEARSKLQIPQLIADAFISTALVFGEKPRELEGAITALSVSAELSFAAEKIAIENLKQATKERLSIDRENEIGPRKPFHWCLEFPEVFFSNRRGFDALLGNPPYLGGSKITISNGENYRSHLVNKYTNSFVGRVDLCVYFLKLAKFLQGENAYCGFVVTNSISQGHNKEAGLNKILVDGLKIYRAEKDIFWPGKANVVVSILWTTNTAWLSSAILNGETVSGINSNLSKEDVSVEINSWNPERLKQNKGLCFRGVEIKGDGFILNNEERNEILLKEKDSEEIIRPFLTGRELNSKWPNKIETYVISFEERSEESSRSFSECWKIVEQKVKPAREKITKQIHEECFWKFWDKRAKQFNDLKEYDEFLVKARDSSEWAFAFISKNYVVSSKIAIFKNPTPWMFAILQSNIHKLWCYHGASKIGSAVTYNPTMGLERFPFPVKSNRLDQIAKKYLSYRDKILRELDISLNEFYAMLRVNGSEVHERFNIMSTDLDQAVANEYGWNDLDLSGWQSLAMNNFSDDFDASEAAQITRNEVFNRLIELNRTYYLEKTKVISKNIQLHETSTSNSFHRHKNSAQIDFSFDPSITSNATSGIAHYPTKNIWGANPVDQILAWLDANKGWFPKNAILTGCGTDESAWNASIAVLIKDGDVESSEIDGVMRYKAVE